MSDEYKALCHGGIVCCLLYQNPPHSLHAKLEKQLVALSRSIERFCFEGFQWPSAGIVEECLIVSVVLFILSML